MCIVRFLLDISVKTHTLHTQYNMLGDSSTITLPKRRMLQFSFTLFLNDRHFLLLTSCVYCVWMGSEVATAARFFPQNLFRVCWQCKTELVSTFPKFPSIWLVVPTSFPTWWRVKWEEDINTAKDGARERDKEGVGSLSSRWQVSDDRNRKQELWETMWPQPSPDGNRPPGGEATLLAEQVTLGNWKPTHTWKLVLQIQGHTSKHHVKSPQTMMRVQVFLKLPTVRLHSHTKVCKAILLLMDNQQFFHPG